MASYLRGQIAKLAGINGETLRFYEKNGLIPAPQRAENGYRIYPEEVLKRLDFIKKVKECGLTIPEIQRFFQLIDKGEINLSELSDYIARKIMGIDEKIIKLGKTREMLAEFDHDLKQGKISPAFQKFLDEVKIKQG